MDNTLILRVNIKDFNNIKDGINNRLHFHCTKKWNDLFYQGKDFESALKTIKDKIIAGNNWKLGVNSFNQAEVRAFNKVALYKIATIRLIGEIVNDTARCYWEVILGEKIEKIETPTEEIESNRN